MSNLTSWRELSVDDLCLRVTSGGTPKRTVPEYYSPATIPWVKTGDLLDTYVSSYSEYISDRGLQESSAKILPADTVLMAMYGATVGALGILSEEATCNQASCALITDPEVCNPRWLFYALLNGRNYIVSQATGAAQQNLSGKTIRQFRFLTPPISEQHAIAEVLGALDDKIAANSRVVAHSDELSQAIFRSALTGNSQMLPLSSIADFVNGRAFTKNASGTGRVVIRIAEMNSGIGTSTVFNDIEVDEKHIARPGDILFAWSGSLTLQRWFRPEGIVNQHIFKVIARDRNPNWLVYELLREKLGYFKRVAANKATTMGHIQRKDLDELVPVPDDASQKHISEQMDALWNTMLNAEQESLQLADTRDALLPQLMSGKLRVRDAEAVVEDVL